uniref:Uncharacterized protein n=1 Tax=Solanum tuberosum TaxID=4113 RepID=M1BIE9_SOLTU
MDNLRSRCRVFLADAIEASAGLDIALLRRLALWFSKLPRCASFKYATLLTVFGIMI